MTLNKKRRRPYVDGFFDECWKANVWLIWPCNQKQLEAYAKRTFLGYSPGSNDGWDGKWFQAETKNGLGRVQVIALKKWSGAPEDIATLSHECFHAVENILLNRVAHSEDSSEVFAYLLDSIVRRCLRMLDGKKPNTDWDR